MKDTVCPNCKATLRVKSYVRSEVELVDEFADLFSLEELTYEPEDMHEHVNPKGVTRLLQIAVGHSENEGSFLQKLRWKVSKFGEKNLWINKKEMAFLKGIVSHSKLRSVNEGKRF